MNRQYNYGISNKNKKDFNSMYLYGQTKQKKNSKGKINANKKNIKNKYNNNQQYGSSCYANDKNNLDKMMLEYQQFVKRYLGESSPISNMSDEKMNKLLEDKSNRYKLFEGPEFQRILKKNDDLDFGNEDFCIQLPEEEEFMYSQDDKLGNNKNNKNDYARRKKLLFKEIQKSDSNEKEKDNEIEKEKENEQIDQINPVKEDTGNEEDGYDDFDDKTDNNKSNEIKKNENGEDNENTNKNNTTENPVSPPEIPDNPINPPKIPDNPITPPKIPDNPITPPKIPDNPITCKIPDNPITPPEAGGTKDNPIDIVYIKEKQEESARKIQKIFRQKKSKEKLYIGYDITEYMVLRIYVKEFDKNKKIKSIEAFGYSPNQRKEIYLIKTIKDLIGIDSISKKGITKIMDEIIEKILLQSDDSINLDGISELQREDNNNDDNNDNSNKNEKIENKDEEIINQNEEGKESEKDFIIENNDEDKKEEANKNEANKIEANKSLSSLEDIDYKF